MKENIYSTNHYCKITEVVGAMPHNAAIAIDHSLLINVFGIGVSSCLTFGIYAPFWLPQGLSALSLKQLATFSDALVSDAQLAGYEKIRIRLPPIFYDENLDLLKFQLCRSGFKVENLALWQSIDCQIYESASAYESSLKHSSRKVLRRFSEIFEFECRELNSVDLRDIEKVYAVIECNRKKIGLRPKYSLQYLKQLALAESERIKIFEFLVNGTRVAAALCHITADKVLYVAAWGDIDHGLPYSPMYKFASSLVEYCLRNKMRLTCPGIFGPR